MTINRYVDSLDMTYLFVLPFINTINHSIKLADVLNYTTHLNCG